MPLAPLLLLSYALPALPPPPPCTCLPPLPLYSLVQLVMYPILNLQLNHRSDLHWYMRSLEQVVIQVGEGEGEGCCYGMREGREWDDGEVVAEKNCANRQAP